MSTIGTDSSYQDSLWVRSRQNLTQYWALGSIFGKRLADDSNSRQRDPHAAHAVWLPSTSLFLGNAGDFNLDAALVYLDNSAECPQR